MKNLLLMAIFIIATFFCVQLIGQTDSVALYEVKHPECFVPKLEAESEIIKDDGSKIVYLRFEKTIPDFLKITNENDAFIENKYISSNEMIFEVGSQESFSINLFNSCGELVILKHGKSVNSQEESDFIVVSPDMGRLLTDFTYSNIPILEFLRLFI